MSHVTVRARFGQDRASVYQKITGKIVAELKVGPLPWVRPLGSLRSRRRYSGVNILIL